MADVVIESLHITVELDGAARTSTSAGCSTGASPLGGLGEGVQADRRFAEQERLMPEHGGFR